MPKQILKQSLAGLKNLNKTKINIRFKKKEQQLPILPPAPKPIPKGLKVIDKYPLYEPFSHVVIVQNPKTGEYKYILDELQLDPLARGVYDRIQEILPAASDT